MCVLATPSNWPDKITHAHQCVLRLGLVLLLAGCPTDGVMFGMWQWVCVSVCVLVRGNVERSEAAEGKPCAGGIFE